MNRPKNTASFTCFVLAAGLFAAALTALLLTNYYNRVYFQELGTVCRQIIEKKPAEELTVLSALKESIDTPSLPGGENILYSYGYHPSDFTHTNTRHIFLLVLTCFLIGGGLFLATLFLWHKRETARINTLTDYLEKVNTRRGHTLFSAGEGAFSKLQDELYKTVTELHQTRDAALKAQSNFAENLYNIAHQIKTPITSISLSVQMMRKNLSSRSLKDPSSPAPFGCPDCWQDLSSPVPFGYSDSLNQIDQQLTRLTHLEESLLLLSRIDAGTLTLERRSVGVYTLLMLSADNLQELFSKADVSVEIPCPLDICPPEEHVSQNPLPGASYHPKSPSSAPKSDDIEIYVDLDWTMEAIMNLLKNCMEHTPPGKTVYTSYAQNPLYTQIMIWDTGSGFGKEDLPHLFERFYRGENAKNGGIGIGLALARAIIERQNGTVTARNLADAGACFEVRFYHPPESL